MADQTKRKRADPKADRAARLEAALRENLKRRKAQARARPERRDEPGEPHDSAGILGDQET
jgi:hypothetical protein